MRISDWSSDVCSSDLSAGLRISSDMAAGADQEGRGRLSSIDLLPEEAEPDIVWASEQLRLREKPAKMILAEFNARLADRGIASISKSAWGRYSVRKAIQFRKLDQVHHISGELRSEEHTSELQSLMRSSYAVF